MTDKEQQFLFNRSIRHHTSIFSAVFENKENGMVVTVWSICWFFEGSRGVGSDLTEHELRECQSRSEIEGWGWRVDLG